MGRTTLREWVSRAEKFVCVTVCVLSSPRILRRLAMRGLLCHQAFASSAGFDKKQSQAAMQFAAFVKAEYEEAGPQVRIISL